MGFQLQQGRRGDARTHLRLWAGGWGNSSQTLFLTWQGAAPMGDPGSIPGLGRPPGESHGQRSLGATVHEVAKSRTRLRGEHFDCSQGVNSQLCWPDPHAAWAGRETAGPGAPWEPVCARGSGDRGTNTTAVHSAQGEDHQPEEVHPQVGTHARPEAVITQAGESKG